VADSYSKEVLYKNAFDLMHDLRHMGEANALSDRLRKPTQRAVFVRAAEIYHQRFANKDGRIRATFEIIVLTGWAAHDSQQKPLRPGSAQTSLAQALAAPGQILSQSKG
jgi:hypothetical protein